MRELLSAYALLSFTFVGSYFLIRLLVDLPLAAMVAADVCFSGFMVYLFRRHQYAPCFWLHPFLLLIISISVANVWFDSGDGWAHTAEATRIIEVGVVNRVAEISLAYQSTNPLLISKILSLGAVPGIAIPKLMFTNASQEAYIVSQSLVLLILLAVLMPLVRWWNVVNDKVLLVFTLFLAISPSFLVFTYAPHRHFITQFSLVFLFRLFRVCSGLTPFSG